MPNNGNIRIEMEVRAGQTIPSPVDNTLSIPGMAADAKATGDRLQEIESDFQATVQTVAEATATVQAYTEDIEANAAAIQANAGGIAANSAAIQENAAAIEENKAAIQEIIDSGAGGIADTVAENTAAIQANAESIAANAQEITEAQEAIGGKLDKPTNDSQPGMNGWTLTHKSDGSTQWSPYGLPGTDQVESALADWLADHPDAVTSVVDGSISKAKLNSDLQGKTDLVSDSIAPAYEDLIFPVPAGSYCRYNSVLYVAVVDIATSEEWTAGHWAVATIGDALFSLLAKTDKSTIAPEYNALTFPVSAGEFCWRDGTLYRAKQAIPSAESWTAAHWQTTNVSDAIKEVENAIKEVENAISPITDYSTTILNTSDMEQGGIGNNGTNTASGADIRLRSHGYFSVTPGGNYVVKITASFAPLYSISFYETNTDVTSTQRIATVSFSGQETFQVPVNNNIHYARLLIKEVDNGQISVSDLTSVTIYDPTTGAENLVDAVLQNIGVKDMIAPTEASTTASMAHAVGEYFILSGVLYQATADIASGAAIVTSGTGANCITVPDGIANKISEVDLLSPINAYGVSLISVADMQQGGLTTTGTNATTAGYDTRLRSKGYFPLTANKTYRVQIAANFNVQWGVSFYSTDGPVATTERIAYTYFSDGYAFTVPDDSNIHFGRLLIKESNSANISVNDITSVRIYDPETSGAASLVNDVSYLMQDTGEYSIGPDFMKRPIRSTYLGDFPVNQAFCYYNGKYYCPTKNGILYVVNSSFEVEQTVSVNLGHANGMQIGTMYPNYAYVSGWDDQNVYVLDLDDISIVETIALPTTGYTTVATDDVNGIMYIFQRSTSPSTEEFYNFIVYDYINEQIIKTHKTPIKFGAMQDCEYRFGRITVLYGLGLASSIGTGIFVCNTEGNILCQYVLKSFASSEPEGINYDVESQTLLYSAYNTTSRVTSLYRIEAKA